MSKENKSFKRACEKDFKEFKKEYNQEAFDALAKELVRI